MCPTVLNREQRLPWSKLAGQFQANLEVFERRTGLGSAVEQVWRKSVSKLLLHSRDGCYQVFSRLPDTPGWLPALTPHNRLSNLEELKEEFAGKMMRTIALAGLGLGYVVRDLLIASRKTFLSFSIPVIIVEPSLLAWAVVLHLFDWREILAEPRVGLCAGPEALSLFDVELNKIDHTPLVLAGGSPWPSGCTEQQLTERMAAADKRRSLIQQQYYKRVTRLYKDRDAAWWARRLANAGVSEPPLRLLGITSRYTTVLQYSMRDWLAAFESLGHQTHLYIEPDEHSYFSSIKLLEQIEQLQPDLVVIIDHLQREYPQAFPPNIPGICWIQDSLQHLFCTEAGRAVRPFEYVCGFGFMSALLDCEYPSERFFPQVIPTNPEQMLDPEERPEDLTPYICDVMYATHYQGSLDALRESFRRPFDEVGQRLVDAAYETMLSIVRRPDFVSDYDFGGVVQRVERETGLHIQDSNVRLHLTDFLWRVADRYLREAAIAVIAAWADQSGRRFHLYGNGWERHPEFASFARGVVEHGKPLGRAYRAAKINLQTGCNSGMHRRVFDGLCAGAFFLLRRTAADSATELWEAIYHIVSTRDTAEPFQLTASDLSEPQAGQFVRYLKVRGCDPNVGTTVDRRVLLDLKVRCEHDWIHVPAKVWPRYDQVLFPDEQHLIERIEYFLENEAERHEILSEMRTVVLERFTYERVAEELLAFIQSGFAGRNQRLL